MGASHSTLQGVHVVVVGGSFGAKNAVEHLHKAGARVTLVCPEERFYNKFGGVRAAAVEGFEDSLLVPYTRIFGAEPRGSVVVRAFATAVDAAKNTVRVQPLGADGSPTAAEVSQTARSHARARARTHTRARARTCARASRGPATSALTHTHTRAPTPTCAVRHRLRLPHSGHGPVERAAVGRAGVAVAVQGTARRDARRGARGALGRRRRRRRLRRRARRRAQGGAPDA